ncbi:ras-GEF domain-containing family member 1C-like isoform X2 [Tigriopus californicus]|uniref:ras-GEF domain-containing family member 1C-like isoform X2 n=1 Tax=Tigriopus californicus TaxID=6832 RepID=UPI0027D9DC4C|nr:ras-GEF domain-containing family member 1C-like isoform X2 [Tigriopus californicus]
MAGASSGGGMALSAEEESLVRTLLGPGHEIVSVEKEVKIHEEEILFINGKPLALEGPQGEEIRRCLLNGTIPSQDLINHLLEEAGLILRPRQTVVQCDSMVVVSHKETTLASATSTTTNPSSPSTTQVPEERPDVKSPDPEKPISFEDFPRKLVHAQRHPEMQHTLLLWSRYFYSPVQLLSCLQRGSHSDKELYSLVSRWALWFPEDFGHEEAMESLKLLFNGLSGPFLNGTADFHGTSHLLQTLSSHLSGLKKQEHKAQSQLNQAKESMLCPLNDSLATAQELTRIEMRHLNLISSVEFVNVFIRDAFKKRQAVKEEDTQKMDPLFQAHSIASNQTVFYDNYVNWFNHLSYLVATSICEWSKIQGEKFSVLEHQLDPTSNFRSYRSTFGAAISRSENASDSIQRIVIPFFSLFVKDLYFAKETQHMEVSADKGLPVTQAQHIANKIMEFARWKDLTCPYQKDPLIAHYLLKSKPMTEEELDYSSFLNEPPMCSFEKSKYKELKAKFKTSSI